MRMLTGKVLSTKMTNTIVISVERKFRHGEYGKVIIRHKKYKAHVDDHKVREGDIVTIRETRPISRSTNFVVAEVVKAAPVVEAVKKAEVKAEAAIKKAAVKKATRRTRKTTKKSSAK